MHIFVYILIYIYVDRIYHIGLHVNCSATNNLGNFAKQNECAG